MLGGYKGFWPGCCVFCAACRCVDAAVVAGSTLNAPSRSSGMWWRRAAREPPPPGPPYEALRDNDVPDELYVDEFKAYCWSSLRSSLMRGCLVPPVGDCCMACNLLVDCGGGPGLYM